VSLLIKCCTPWLWCDIF